MSKPSERRQRCIRRLLGQQGGKCFYCQQAISEDDASLDHLVPKSAGGLGADNNLVVCCRPLNFFLGNVTFKVKLRILTDPDFLRAVARWCLVIERNRVPGA